MRAPQISCSFSGHRPEKLPWGDNERDERCLALKASMDEMVRKAYDDGYRHFICGMARGCDTYFCEAVLRLRDRVQDITLEAEGMRIHVTSIADHQVNAAQVWLLPKEAPPEDEE